ncbi:MAG TPA: DUF262 domain-containing protein [Vampirovibrionales bacterium]
MKFKDIPSFMDWRNYTITVPWSDLEAKLDGYRKDYNLDLDPDFQRGHVWTPEKQSAYVEYIMRGGDTSKNVIFNCPGWNGAFEGQMVLVDGKQRLEAVLSFLSNKVAIFGGHYYQDIEENPRRYQRFTFNFHVADLARKDVLRLYLELNSGGVVHTEEELEKVRKLIAEEANNGN